MPRPQVAVTVTTNRFSALADSDSEHETPSAHVEVQEKVEQTKQTEEVSAPPSPTLRTWATEPNDSRWNLDMKKNIFASPFSKHKRPRPPRQDSKEGWTSIRVPEAKTPPFPPDSPVEMECEIPPIEPLDEVKVPPSSVQEKEQQQQEQDFPSLLSRGKGIVLEATIPTSTFSAEPTKIPEEQTLENLNALMWAERIKRSLERAEHIRIEKARQPTATGQELVGRLSFFRRALPEEGTKIE